MFRGRRNRNIRSLDPPEFLPAPAPAPAPAAAIEEFRALHEELRSRLEKQQEITSYAIAFIAAIAVAISFLTNNKSNFERLAPAYPMISIVLSGFTLMTIDHDMNIAHIYEYIDKHLVPLILDLTDRSPGKLKIWDWNRYRANQQQGRHWSIILTGPISAGKYTMTLFPNLLLAGFIAYYGTVHSHGWLRLWYFAPSLAVVWTLCASFYIINLYFKMVEKKTSPPSDSS